MFCCFKYPPSNWLKRVYFAKTVFQAKILLNMILHLTEKSEIVKSHKRQETLNGNFVNAVKNLDISRFLNSNPLIETIKDINFKAILT